MKYRFKNVITAVIVDIDASSQYMAQSKLKAEYSEDDYENFQFLEIVNQKRIFEKEEEEMEDFFIYLIGDLANLRNL